MIGSRWGFFSILLLVSAPSQAAVSSVLLSSSVVMPGQTLRVEVDQWPPAETLDAVWNKKTYRLYPVGPDALRGLIGVPLGAVPGTFVLQFKSVKKTPGLVMPSPMTITVATRTFPIDNVQFPADKTRIFNENLERQEGAKIHKALLQLRSEQFWEGVLDPPVSGAVIGPFGTHRLRNSTIDAGFHKGLDLRAAENTPVKASNAGVVVLASSFHIHGRTVLVDHGQGVMTIYLHMKSFAVHPGQKVAKGESLGRVGSTGLSTAPHVHWGVYVHGVPVDPQQWIDTEF
jgi:murein DD-endopeptidase MepM/ murein hydrolase activator NlpD